MWHHNHIWLNDANKHYIQEDKEEDRSTMAQRATMIYYKSLPNCPTKNKQRQLYTFSFLMFQQAKEGNKISVECNFSLFRVSTYSVSTNLQPLLFSIHFCGGFFCCKKSDCCKFRLIEYIVRLAKTMKRQPTFFHHKFLN